MTKDEIRMTNRHCGRLVLIALATALLASAGCVSLDFRWLTDPGTQTKRDVYLNLMTADQQVHFWEMEREEASASLKMAYLQEIGVYQKWVEQPKEVQIAILHRQVVENMSPLQVRLAWGAPEEERDETEPADRVAGRKKTVWEFGPRLLKTGETRYDREVCFVDDRVLWVRRNP